LEEPDGQKVALGHVLHVRCELAPNFCDEVPSGQAVQLLMLVSAFASENVPVGHILHAVMFSAAKADDHVPAGHGKTAVPLLHAPAPTQSVAPVAPAPVALGQGRGLARPAAGQKKLRGQGRQPAAEGATPEK